VKKFISIFLSFAFIFIFVPSINAQLKIAVVDIYKVLNESEKGKKAVADLQNILESRQKILEEKQKKIQMLREEYERKKSVLSEDARKTKEDEIERLGRELQRTAVDYQIELEKKQNEITQSMLKEIREIINEIAQKEGYDLILEKAEQIVVYVTNNIDITDKVISFYNQKAPSLKQKK